MASTAAAAHNPALDPDTDAPDDPGHELAEFGAGCFWGVELAFQRVVGVVKTEVGYSQGHVPDPNYKLVCSKTTNHVEVVRVQFDPKVCPYTSLLSLFWSRHDPTSLNRQGGDVGTQYRSGIYYYNENQARLAQQSKEAKQLEFKQERVFFLFTDMLVYGSEVDGGAGAKDRRVGVVVGAAGVGQMPTGEGRYQFHRKMNLDGVMVVNGGVERDEKGRWRERFEIRSAEKSFAVYAPSPESKQEWMRAIRDATEAMMSARQTLIHSDNAHDPSNPATDDLARARALKRHSVATPSASPGLRSRPLSFGAMTPGTPGSEKRLSLGVGMSPGSGGGVGVGGGIVRSLSPNGVGMSGQHSRGASAGLLTTPKKERSNPMDDGDGEDDGEGSPKGGMGNISMPVGGMLGMGKGRVGSGDEDPKDEVVPPGEEPQPLHERQRSRRWSDIPPQTLDSPSPSSNATLIPPSSPPPHDELRDTVSSLPTPPPPTSTSTSLSNATRAGLKIIDNYSAPVWVPDSKATRCMRCSGFFNLWRRRHHCRLCGAVVCWSCSSHQFIIPSSTTSPAERIARACDACYRAVFPDTPGRHPQKEIDGEEGEGEREETRGSYFFKATPVLEARPTCDLDFEEGEEGMGMGMTQSPSVGMSLSALSMAQAVVPRAEGLAPDPDTPISEEPGMDIGTPESSSQEGPFTPGQSVEALPHVKVEDSANASAMGSYEQFVRGLPGQVVQAVGQAKSSMGLPSQIGGGKEKSGAGAGGPAKKRQSVAGKKLSMVLGASHFGR